MHLRRVFHLSAVLQHTERARRSILLERGTPAVTAPKTPDLNPLLYKIYQTKV